MSNYKYLREIIEKIAEKGKVPKEDIADTMNYIRTKSSRIKDADHYINNPLLEDNMRNKYSLDDFVSEMDNRDLRYISSYTNEAPSFYSNVDAPTHNKYNKYMPIRKRINEREEVLMNLIHLNRENEEKAKLYEALLERLENHPLYNERNY